MIVIKPWNVKGLSKLLCCDTYVFLSDESSLTCLLLIYLYALPSISTCMHLQDYKNYRRFLIQSTLYGSTSYGSVYMFDPTILWNTPTSSLVIYINFGIVSIFDMHPIVYAF